MQILNRIFNREAPSAKKKSSVKSDFLAFLNSYNCKYNLEDDREEKLVRIFFDYQGGHYVAIIKDNNMGVDVNFPSFTDAPTNEIQLVRAICNRANSNSSILKFTYSFDEDKHLIRVHLSFFCTTVYAEELSELLNACFYFQRTFCEEYKGAKENQENHSLTDIELTYARNERERFLIAEQELRHQAGDEKELRASLDQPLTLADFMAIALGYERRHCKSMSITRGDKVEQITEDIACYDLSRLLIAGEGKGANLAHSMATAIILLTTIDHETPNELSEQLLTITAQPAGQDDTSIYYRLTACLCNQNINRSNALDSSKSPVAVDLLAAYDKASPEQKMQEFDYMWKDAVIKMRDGDELTDEQQLIVDITDANIGYCLYWGKHYMLSGRYVDALRFFENAYNAMNPSFFMLNKELRSTFSELCYNIGFCYTELKLYQKAFYYLNLLEDDGNIRHNSELINCLANGRDVRVFKVIDGIMHAIQEHAEKNDSELPDEVQSFANFLLRRRAYSLIEFGDLDEAEKSFTQMLEDPDNSDYALGELAYIKRLRDARAQNIDNNTPEEASDDKTGHQD